MQKYKASIKIMPLKELLDPQGKTVSNNMKNLQIDTVEDVRIGKFIEMYLSAKSRDEAEQVVDKACKKLLANMIMEQYEFELTEI